MTQGASDRRCHEPPLVHAPVDPDPFQLYIHSQYYIVTVTCPDTIIMHIEPH